MKIFSLGVRELKILGGRFTNLLCRTYFRCYNEISTFWQFSTLWVVVFSFVVTLKPIRLLYFIFSFFKPSKLLLALQYVLFPCIITPIFFNNTSAKYRQCIMATLLHVLFSIVICFF